MPSHEPSKATGLETYIARVKEEIPSAENLLEAFRELLVQETRLKETLRLPVIEMDLRHLRRDFGAGIPLGSRAEVKIPGDELARAARVILSALGKGFPHISPQLEVLSSAFEASGELILSAVDEVICGKDDEVKRRAEVVGIETDVLEFVLERLIKPFAEKWAEAAGLMVKDLEWLRGYCPLCGSWPNFSFWRGEGGRRWLHCSFCGHEWTFARTVCPFCENDNQQMLQSIFLEDRPYEAADVCLECKRYLLRKDLRQEVFDVFPEVAALGMACLDALAQDREFRPPTPDERAPSQAH